MSYGGLRGAVAFGLALSIKTTVPNYKLFITTCVAMVYWTVFVQGNQTFGKMVRLIHTHCNMSFRQTISADKVDAEPIMTYQVHAKVRELNRRSSRVKKNWKKLSALLQQLPTSYRKKGNSRNHFSRFQNNIYLLSV